LKTIQIIVISLEHSLDRRKKVTEELSKVNFSWSFMDAVDGRKLNYPIPEYPAKKVCRLLGFPLTPNEIGCFLSHKKVWELTLQNNITTLVFEDDFILLPHFVDVIQQLINDPQSWDLVRLQALNQCSDTLLKEYGQFSLNKNHDDPLGATAYLVNPDAAASLINHASSIYEPLDHFLEHHQKHGIPMLAIKPYPVDVTRVESTISDRPNDRKPIKGLKKRLRSLYRLLDRITAREPWFPK
jgi:glycosyl transferase family 25